MSDALQRVRQALHGAADSADGFDRLLAELPAAQARWVSALLPSEQVDGPYGAEWAEVLAAHSERPQQRSAPKVGRACRPRRASTSGVTETKSSAPGALSAHQGCEEGFGRTTSARDRTSPSPHSADGSPRTN